MCIMTTLNLSQRTDDDIIEILLTISSEHIRFTMVLPYYVGCTTAEVLKFFNSDSAALRLTDANGGSYFHKKGDVLSFNVYTVHHGHVDLSINKLNILNLDSFLEQVQVLWPTKTRPENHENALSIPFSGIPL